MNDHVRSLKKAEIEVLDAALSRILTVFIVIGLMLCSALVNFESTLTEAVPSHRPVVVPLRGPTCPFQSQLR